MWFQISSLETFDWLYDKSCFGYKFWNLRFFCVFVHSFHRNGVLCCFYLCLNTFALLKVSNSHSSIHSRKISFAIIKIWIFYDFSYFFLIQNVFPYISPNYLIKYCWMTWKEMRLNNQFNVFYSVVWFEIFFRKHFNKWLCEHGLVKTTHHKLAVCVRLK